MSLDPSPLSASPTPLLSPTDPSPGRGSALVGAIISVALAALIAFVSLRFGTQLLYATQGLDARNNVAFAAQGTRVQGFNLFWTKSLGSASDGYPSPDAAQVLQDEASNYHMNMVVINVTANALAHGATTVNYSANNTDTYDDATYTNVVKAAQAAGLTPVFELDIRLTNEQGSNFLSTQIGKEWADDTGNPSAERHWFDSYTAFVVYYAQLSQKLHMPALIIGHNLPFMTTDDNSPKGQPWPNDPKYTCKGRRDCAWRHVISAIKSTTYLPFYTDKKKTPQTGGAYQGELIYAATSLVGGLALSYPEWKGITWWDALNVIGIDADIPLTVGSDVPPETLVDAWNGKTDNAPLVNTKENFVKELGQLNRTYQRNILFTTAGYESYGGSNRKPGQGNFTQASRDDNEQLFDMRALYDTFTPQPWWLGVVWSADYPVIQRSELVQHATSNYFFEQDWATNTEWAGDCTQDKGCPNPEKAAGVWLRTTYKKTPLIPSTWDT